MQQTSIDKYTALHLIEYLPNKSRYIHYFWTTVMILLVPVSIIFGLFFSLIGFVIIAFIAIPLLFNGIKTNAAEMVLKHAEENKHFFKYLIENKLVTIQDEHNM